MRAPARVPAGRQDAARFAYVTGWRIGAIRTLAWRDVNLRDRTLQLRAVHAKNKRAKLLPLAGDLFALLDRQAAQRDPACPLVFSGRTGTGLGDFRKAWRTACQAAGVHGLLFHDFRRSAARNAIRAGVPEHVVMELGGWRTRSMLQRYNVVSEHDLATALDRVADYVSARATEAPKIQPLRPEPAQSACRQLRATWKKPKSAKR